MFFKTLVTLIALSLIVIFQPELRRFLGYLGQPGFIKRTFFQSGTYREASEGDTDILKEVMGDLDVEFTDKVDTQFKCNCSKERIAGALAGISKKDLEEIINDGKEINVKCDFCNTDYKFSIAEIKKIKN